MRKIIVVLAAGALAAGAWLGLRRAGGEGAPRYRFARVERGDLRITVTATGTVQPVTQVQVGTQVSGTVQTLGSDFNARVKKGQILAQIDPAPFQARVDQDRANLARAEAEVERVKASLRQAERELSRSKDLAARELISASELDAAVANHGSLTAQVKVADAAVAQGAAALRNSEVNLKYTTILSPADGVVVSRNVDVGQTVAASLQAPTLFVIADLERVQVQASVPEAEIGAVSEGQEAAFTVDAFRDRRFRGRVAQVRLAPTTVQNVVTYTVIVDAENPGEKLLPGMTATVVFHVEERPAVLKVSNAALRFVPPDAPPPVDRGGRRKEWGGGGARPPRARVWVRRGAGLAPVAIATGPSDGMFTEVVDGDLAEAQEVAVGLLREDRTPSVSNPFAPPRGGGRIR